MELKLITKDNFFKSLLPEHRPWQKDYLVMYSSQWDGITFDPDLMSLPVDDHLVHRGDGVFEVIRSVNGKLYCMNEHLERLERSAGAIFIELPKAYGNIRELIKKLVIVGGEPNCLVKIIISRGPGSFGINPYDCPCSQVYINVLRFKKVPEKYYQEGISIVTSSIPIKKSFFANIKSCNYLPNVLMKMEAVKAGCPFAVNNDEDGFLAEGSTENIGVYTSDGILKFPGIERTLAGITVNNVYKLAIKLRDERMIRDVQFTRILPEEAYNAEEVFLTGTSINILPVINFDKRKIGTGAPGPVYSKLSELLWEDMTNI